MSAGAGWNPLPESSSSTGVPDTEDESMDTFEKIRRGKRARKQPQRLTYDKLGKSSARARSAFNPCNPKVEQRRFSKATK